MSGSSKAGLIAELRARIAAHETPQASLGDEARTGAPLGSALDGALPGGGLRRDALHEIAAADYRDMGAGLGFLAALAVRIAAASPMAPILWCEGARAPFDVGGIYGPGLAAFGLDPSRLILVTPPRETELLWSLEEALKLGAFAAVIGEIDGRAKSLDLVATRRLQLAAEEGRTPLLLFTGHESADASVAVTRWRVAAAASAPGIRLDGQSTEIMGRARWRVALERCRGAEEGGSWLVEWNAREKAFAEIGNRLAPERTAPGLRLVS